MCIRTHFRCTIRIWTMPIWIMSLVCLSALFKWFHFVGASVAAFLFGHREFVWRGVRRRGGGRIGFEHRTAAEIRSTQLSSDEDAAVLTPLYTNIHAIPQVQSSSYSDSFGPARTKAACVIRYVTVMTQITEKCIFLSIFTLRHYGYLERQHALLCAQDRSYHPWTLPIPFTFKPFNPNTPCP